MFYLVLYLLETLLLIFKTHSICFFCKLSSILHSFVLTQVITQPTHSSSLGKLMLIDFLLLSVPSQLLIYSVIQPLCNPDHNGIDLTLKLSCKSVPAKSNKLKIYRYAHADFDKANTLISEADWTFYAMFPAEIPSQISGSKNSCQSWRSVFPKSHFGQT